MTQSGEDRQRVLVAVFSLVTNPLYLFEKYRGRIWSNQQIFQSLELA